MEQDELGQWSRHYDSLLWNVTTIFMAAIGALLVYSYSNFNFIISIAGMVLTCVPVYFAASFRELQNRVNAQLDVTTRNILFKKRKFLQWWVYVGIFVGQEVLWTILLLSKKPESRFIITTFCIAIIVITVALGYLGYNRKGDNKDDDKTLP